MAVSAVLMSCGLEICDVVGWVGLEVLFFDWMPRVGRTWVTKL